MLIVATTASEYRVRRNKYSYPAVGLKGELASLREEIFSTTYQTDCHHKELLISDANERTVLGYLSTIYWGHYLGKSQRANPKRSLGKVRLALNGKDRVKQGKSERMRGVSDLGVGFVANQIRAAYTQLKEGHYSKAIELLCHLPQLRLAFASKICAFLIPEKCGVIDSVIARNYPQFGFKVNDRNFLDNTLAHRKNYCSYCGFLQQEARTLNSFGRELMWEDRDKKAYSWRAVDVERALYTA